MSTPARGCRAVHHFLCALLGLVLTGIGLAHESRVCESASSAAPDGSGDLKIRLSDGKKLTLHDWTLEGDTLRATRDVWIDYERVRKPVAFALSEVTLLDGRLSWESLRSAFEAKQAKTAATPRADPSAVPGPSGAQPATPSVPAVRMRLRLADSPKTWWKGTLLRASSDSLWLLSSGLRDTLAIERARVSQLQRYEGKTSVSGKGALIGLGFGTLTAFGLAVSTQIPEGYTGAVFLGVAVFAGAGALLGALIGGVVRKDEWVDVSHVGLSIQGSTESIRMSVGFGPPPSGAFAAGDRP